MRKELIAEPGTFLNTEDMQAALTEVFTDFWDRGNVDPSHRPSFSEDGDGWKSFAKILKLYLISPEQVSRLDVDKGSSEQKNYTKVSIVVYAIPQFPWKDNGKKKPLELIDALCLDDDFRKVEMCRGHGLKTWTPLSKDSSFKKSEVRKESSEEEKAA